MQRYGDINSDKSNRVSKQASWKVSGWVDSGVCQSEMSEWSILAENRPEVYDYDRGWLNWSADQEGSKITERP